MALKTDFFNLKLLSQRARTQFLRKGCRKRSAWTSSSQNFWNYWKIIIMKKVRNKYVIIFFWGMMNAHIRGMHGSSMHSTMHISNMCIHLPSKKDNNILVSNFFYNHYFSTISKVLWRTRPSALFSALFAWKLNSSSSWEQLQVEKVGFQCHSYPLPQRVLNRKTLKL